MQTDSQVSQHARHYSNVFLTSALQAKSIDSNIKSNFNCMESGGDKIIPVKARTLLLRSRGIR